MFCIAALILLINFAFNNLVSGGDLQCQLTSNHGNNSNMTEVDLHENLILNCSSAQTNSSNLTFEWTLNGHLLRNRVSIKNITDVAWHRAGKYECVIKQNQNLESCDFLVKVKTLPHVTIGRFDVLQGKMKLPCYVKDYYKPIKIIWYKNDQQIFPNNTDYFVKTKTQNDFVIISTLGRNSPSFNDTGNYSCEARNIYGTTRKYTYVSKDKISGFMHKNCPAFKRKSSEINVTISVGSSTSILCEVIGDTYGKSAVPFLVKMGSNISTLYDVGGNSKNIYNRPFKGDGTWLINYTIVNAVKNDSGQYKCDFLHSHRYHCPKYLYKIFNVKVLASSSVNKKQLNLLMVIAVSVSGAVCGLALVLYVCHLRRKLKAQLYENCPDYLPELRWDVFVSYSSHDFEWVNDLCQMLEQPPFNLIVCLHQRDWELGRSVVDNMVDSVYCSHKTLIIVSKHYVQSEYCMQELQIAMHSEIASELVRKERIVLIKIDDVSMQRLPRVLRQKSYLDCSDPEHVRHFKTNLLRVLPKRERLEEEPGPSEDQRSSDESNTSSSSGEIRLQELQIV